MAIYYSTQAADQSTNNDYTDASKRLQGDFGSSPLILDATVASWAANDLVILSILPPGVYVDCANSYVYTPGGASTLTLDIGDFDLITDDWDNLSEAADARNVDRYADGIDMSSAGVILFTSGTIPLEVTTPARTTTPGLLVAKVATSSSPGTDKLNFVVNFKRLAD